MDFFHGAHGAQPTAFNLLEWILATLELRGLFPRGLEFEKWLRSASRSAQTSISRKLCAAAWALALQLARTSVLHAKEALVLRDSIDGVVVEEAAWPAMGTLWGHEEIRPRGGGKKRTRNEFG